MTEDDELARIGVLEAHKTACRVQGIAMETGIKTALLAWCRDEALTTAGEPDGPPEATIGIRRREACVAAIHDARRQGIEIPSAILERMIMWSWERTP